MEPCLCNPTTKMNEHGPIIAEVMVAWAEAGVMANTLTEKEITNLKTKVKLINYVTVVVKEKVSDSSNTDQ